MSHDLVVGLASEPNLRSVKALHKLVFNYQTMGCVAMTHRPLMQVHQKLNSSQVTKDEDHYGSQTRVPQWIILFFVFFFLKCGSFFPCPHSSNREEALSQCHKEPDSVML